MENKIPRFPDLECPVITCCNNKDGGCKIQNAKMRVLFYFDRYTEVRPKRQTEPLFKCSEYEEVYRERI